jgi:hypothetical protein
LIKHHFRRSKQTIKVKQHAVDLLLGLPETAAATTAAACFQLSRTCQSLLLLLLLLLMVRMVLLLLLLLLVNSSCFCFPRLPAPAAAVAQL